MEKVKITAQICPMCGVSTGDAVVFAYEKENTCSWYRCNCGITFRQKELTFEDDTCDKHFQDSSDLANLRRLNACRLYMPIIEELVTSRKALILGLTNIPLLKELPERGWITWGLDTDYKTWEKANNECKNPKLQKGDFLTLPFQKNIKDKILTGNQLKTIDLKFDLIWLENTLQNYFNPFDVLKKCRDLLTENGVLFIDTGDTYFTASKSNERFPYYDPNKGMILWNHNSLKKFVEAYGFDVILNYNNFASRFNRWYNTYLIAQKHYF